MSGVLPLCDKKAMPSSARSVITLVVAVGVPEIQDKDQSHSTVAELLKCLNSFSDNIAASGGTWMDGWMVGINDGWN